MTSPAPRGVTRRFNRGNYHWYKLDGDKVDGVTTILNDGIPKGALVNWAAGVVANYASDNIATLAALEPDERIDLMKGQPARDRDRLARRGTEVHRLAEQLIAGEKVDVPDELVGHVDSYLRFLSDWDVQPVIVEGVCGHHAHRWMGTFDLVADISNRRWILDLKTTRSGIFGETALQIAAYRHAEFYLDANGRQQPMPACDAAGAVWVRADGYDLVPVEAGDDVYRMFRYAQQVAHFTKRYSAEWIHDALQPEREEAS